MKRVVHIQRKRAVFPVLTTDQVRVIQRERVTQTERALLAVTALVALPVPAMAISIGVALVAGWVR